MRVYVGSPYILTRACPQATNIFVIGKWQLVQVNYLETVHGSDGLARAGWTSVHAGRGEPRAHTGRGLTRVETVLACRFVRFANRRSWTRNRLVVNHGSCRFWTGTWKYGLNNGSVRFGPSQTARMAGSTCKSTIHYSILVVWHNSQGSLSVDSGHISPKERTCIVT